MGELDLSRARPEESGFYVCVGVDPAGNSANTTFRIDVEGEGEGGGEEEREELKEESRCTIQHTVLPWQQPHSLNHYEGVCSLSPTRGGTHSPRVVLHSDVLCGGCAGAADSGCTALRVLLPARVLLHESG